MKENIRDIDQKRLRKMVLDIGEPEHRVNQILFWVNRKGATSFDEMTDIPKTLIAELKRRFTAGSLKLQERLVSKDGTEKFLWELADGNYVESVLLSEKKRKTICLSTQVGCKFKCPFCASGTGGFKRDLMSSEIIEQLIFVQKLCQIRVTNVVFMGMGEPLDNFGELAKSIHMINSSEGIGVGARKITVSTCGIVPGILKLKDLGLQVELSISLHATRDNLRNELVPANRKYPLKKLIPACERFYADTGRVITLEYTLIKGRNDSAGDASELAVIAKMIKARVNLIPCNYPGSQGYSGSDAKTVEAFKRTLISKGINVTARRSRGKDILAACGQLAARERNKEG